MVPQELKYTEEHEWVRVVSGSRVRVGLTDFAQNQLGDIVFVTLPKIGDALAAGESLGEVESTKSVSDIYAPLAGKVAAVNEDLEAEPALVNSGPYDDGWLVELDLADVGGLDGLLDAAKYSDLITMG
ncbi:glycine cleavage system H protein [Kitasatospora sp. SolWspMP-SS2h]|nr:glycine cleavage system H protein [Kitasatospora sp. SolWspMP-SS2h]